MSLVPFQDHHSMQVKGPESTPQLFALLNCVYVSLGSLKHFCVMAILLRGLKKYGHKHKLCGHKLFGDFLPFQYLSPFTVLQ